MVNQLCVESMRILVEDLRDIRTSIPVYYMLVVIS